METKLVKVPFEVELAKRIQNGDVEGKIITDDGRIVRIVCVDMNSDDCIVALVQGEFKESVYTYTPDGRVFVNDKSPLDLMLEIPEYMAFKDGDVIVYDNVKNVFFIIGSKCSMTDENPHYYVKYEKGYLTFGEEDSFCRLKYSRLATESEKQKLIDALKASKAPKAKEYLKRFFGIEQKQEYEFKPFDKVIGRDDYSEWFVDMFSHIDNDGLYACIGSVWKYCLPYNEQTAHLLGTEKDYKED